MFDYLIYIGRFQPVHKGHIHVIREALKKAKTLILFIGSHQKARDIRNPWTTEERIDFIKASLNPDEVARIKFIPQFDYTYNDDRWIAAIQSAVNAVVYEKYSAGPIKIGLVGYDKDHSTYYLKKFPQWKFIPIEPDPNLKWMNATKFRREYFDETKVGPHYTWHDFVTFSVMLKLTAFKLTREYTRLEEEFDIVEKYQASWKNSPYPPTFVTVDAVVRQSGHLLLIQRGPNTIGSGLWALPGGFVKEGLSLEESMIEELYEETGLKVPKPVIKGSIHGRRTFDDPHRSVRGRTITETFDVRLSEAFELPKVKGGDDAAKAFWLPFSEVERNRHEFFEDHFSILQSIIGL